MVEQSLIELNEARVRERLFLVKDPEIPTISIVDLGIVRTITIDAEKRAIEVVICPTFVGCPAMDYIQRDIEQQLAVFEASSITVKVDQRAVWSTNMLSEAGRAALARHGLALPPHFQGDFEPEILLNAECPFCHSSNTQLVSPFGPTLCRALYHCNSCKQGFEQFKAV